MSAYPPAPGTPSLATSAIPPIPPGSPTAPGTGCCTATPSLSTITLPKQATGLRLAAGRSAAERGDLDGLRTHADVGDRYAAVRSAKFLADLLIKQGRGDEAKRLRQFG